MLVNFKPQEAWHIYILCRCQVAVGCTVISAGESSYIMETKESYKFLFPLFCMKGSFHDQSLESYKEIVGLYNVLLSYGEKILEK